MQVLPYTVTGDRVEIKVIETTDDLNEFVQWLVRTEGKVLALDTETTGTNIYARDFKIRTVQIGDETTAYVLPVDERSDSMIAQTRSLLQKVITKRGKWMLHNAPFDTLVLSRSGLLQCSVRDFQAQTVDTYLMAHLLDPRAAGEDNAMGHGLKALSSALVDPLAADTQSGLTGVFRTEFKLTKDKGWAAVGLTWNDTYLLYGGLDVIYTSRLYPVLMHRLKVRGLTGMLEFEQKVQSVTLGMEARGILIDVDYTKRLVQELTDEAEQNKEVAARFGVENINSTAQVADGLIASGVKLTAKTKSDAYQVSADVLLPLAGLTPYWTPIEGATPHPLAEAIVRAKRAEKWRVAYAEAFLDYRDENDRVHPGLKSLAARTGRMSIANPPLQQLPAGDWRIRRCFIPDPGNVFISSDFAQIELRVLAASAGVEQMIDAIETNVDLHNRTASLVWPDWAARDNDDPIKQKQRKIAKNVAFGYVYGAGARKTSETAGISFTEARKVLTAFENAYPELPAYNNRLQDQTRSNGWLVVNSFGREMPVSPNRVYTVVNYATQGAARDVFAEALLRVDEKIGDNLSLVIHDEILHQAPLAEAEAQAKLVQSLMQGEFHGVPIASSSNILYGGSWGSGYDIPPEFDRVPEDHRLRKKKE